MKVSVAARRMLILTLSGVVALGLGGLLAAAPAAEETARPVPSLTLPAAIDEPVTLRVDSERFAGVRDWSRLFIVYVDKGTHTTAPTPIAGTYQQEGGTVTFRPDFPFSPGTRYRAEIAGELALDQGEKGFSITRAGREFVGIPFAFASASTPPPPFVDRIFPTSDALPENILRFYIYFSQPMRRGFASRSVALYDAEGARVENAFMAFKQELWSPNQKRLTVLLDPGRIKRGVGTNLRLGPALVSGRSYRLVVDAAWEDAHGQRLDERFEKSFRVTKALRSAPTPAEWTVVAPRAHSQEPLTLTFKRALDHALLGRMITVLDANGHPLPGNVEITREETRWSFRPAQVWKPGAYRALAQPALEDVAGNNLHAPLDHLRGTAAHQAVPASLSFEVRTAQPEGSQSIGRPSRAEHPATSNR